MVGDTAVGSFVANEPRVDAEDGHGFAIELLPDWLSDGKNVLSVWTRPEGALIRAPVTYRRKPQARPPSAPGPGAPQVPGATRAQVKYVARPEPVGDLDLGK